MSPFINDAGAATAPDAFGRDKSLSIDLCGKSAHTEGHMNKEEFKALLKEALAEQSKQFDEKLGVLSNQVDEKLRGLADLVKAVAGQSNEFDGKLVKQAGYLEQRLQEIEAKIDGLATAEQINALYQLIDGIAKRIHDDDQERAAIVNHQDRQDGWIAQLARATNTKLIPEQ